MAYSPPIDVTQDFVSDSRGRDLDRYSPTLQGYHRLLWSRPLPDGTVFGLEPVRSRGSFLLRYSGVDGDLYLSSDILANSSRGPCGQLYELVPEDARTRFHSVGRTIGGRLIFPAQGVGRIQTINQRRGTHPRIRDRFDLTLECIRRHYHAEESPLTEVLAANDGFFRLFGDFAHYVEFFLLQDLVDDTSTSIRFYLPFDGFNQAALPQTYAQYEDFLRHQIDFIEARNRRITRMTTGFFHDGDELGHSVGPSR